MNGIAHGRAMRPQQDLLIIILNELPMKSISEKLVVSLSESHARLLSTKTELLPSWKAAVESKETPVGWLPAGKHAYLALIEATINEAPVDYESLTQSIFNGISYNNKVNSPIATDTAHFKYLKV